MIFLVFCETASVSTQYLLPNWTAPINSSPFLDLFCSLLAGKPRRSPGTGKASSCYGLPRAVWESSWTHAKPLVKSGPWPRRWQEQQSRACTSIFLDGWGRSTSVRTAPPFFPGMQGWRPCEGDHSTNPEMQIWGRQRCSGLKWDDCFSQRCTACLAIGSLEDARLRASVFLSPAQSPSHLCSPGGWMKECVQP